MHVPQGTRGQQRRLRELHISRMASEAVLGERCGDVDHHEGVRELLVTGLVSGLVVGMLLVDLDDPDRPQLFCRVGLRFTQLVRVDDGEAADRCALYAGLARDHTEDEPNPRLVRAEVEGVLLHRVGGEHALRDDHLQAVAAFAMIAHDVAEGHLAAFARFALHQEVSGVPPCRWQLPQLDRHTFDTLIGFVVEHRSEHAGFRRRGFTTALATACRARATRTATVGQVAEVVELAHRGCGCLNHLLRGCVLALATEILVDPIHLRLDLRQEIPDGLLPLVANRSFERDFLVGIPRRVFLRQIREVGVPVQLAIDPRLALELVEEGQWLALTAYATVDRREVPACRIVVELDTERSIRRTAEPKLAVDDQLAPVRDRRNWNRDAASGRSPLIGDTIHHVDLQARTHVASELRVEEIDERVWPHRVLDLWPQAGDAHHRAVLEDLPVESHEGTGHFLEFRLDSVRFQLRLGRRLEGKDRRVVDLGGIASVVEHREVAAWACPPFGFDAVLTESLSPDASQSADPLARRWQLAGEADVVGHPFKRPAADLRDHFADVEVGIGATGSDVFPVESQDPHVIVEDEGNHAMACVDHGQRPGLADHPDFGRTGVVGVVDQLLGVVAGRLVEVGEQ